MDITLFGKWSLVDVRAFGEQPPFRGVGLVVKSGPDVGTCFDGDRIIFLNIECGVLIYEDGFVLVHEDYVVAKVGNCQ